MSTNNNYLNELQKKFPETPFSIIAKTDIILNGVNPNEAMLKLSEQTISFPFQAKEKGQLGFSPSQFSFPDGTSTLVIPEHSSPYEFKIVDEKPYIYRDGDYISEIVLVEKPKYLFNNTSFGSAVYTLFLQRGDSCIIISPTNFCEYFRTGEECRFCAFNPVWEKAKTLGFKTVNKPEDVAEGIKMCMDEIPLDHIKLCGGSFYDTHQEAKFYAKFAEEIKKQTGIEKIDIISQAYTKDDAKMLQDKGVIEACWDIEVWQENLWSEIVPGKKNAVGYQEWVKRMISAVEVFGEGHIGSNIVGGVETTYENGFKDIDTAVASTFEGCKFLVKNGVLPTISVWFAQKGSKYENKKVASIEYHLKLGWKLHTLLKESGMYEKTGHQILGSDPSYRRIFCHKCCFDNISQDYPRLVKE